MQKESKKTHKHLQEFNPEVQLLEEAFRDFSVAIRKFNAGLEYTNFNEFIHDEAILYRDAGEGVTYVVWNVYYNFEGEETTREIVAFYTLSATAIPYEDRIRLDEEEAELSGEEFDVQICGIPAIEIKMFAIDEMYQDIFFEYKNDDLPIAAWIMRNIISYTSSLLNDVLGFKALFLHSLPEAEMFYRLNGFHPIEKNMKPLHNIDSEYQAMYLALKTVHMNCDE